VEEKNLSIKISEDTLIKIKKLALDSKVSPSKQASLLLEKLLNKKKMAEVELNTDMD